MGESKYYNYKIKIGFIMPPKFDPTAVTTLYLRVTGGETTPSMTRKLNSSGSGLNSKKTSEDIIKETQKKWKGIRITVKLTVQNRQAKIEVIPTASSLIIKALKEPPRDRKKVKNIKHAGNLTLDEVVTAAKVMQPRSCAASLSGTVCEILGTAMPIGCTINDRKPKEMLENISRGIITISD